MTVTLTAFVPVYKFGVFSAQQIQYIPVCDSTVNLDCTMPKSPAGVSVSTVPKIALRYVDVLSGGGGVSTEVDGMCGVLRRGVGFCREGVLRIGMRTSVSDNWI